MGKALADPLFMFLVAAIAAQWLIFRRWSRLTRLGRLGLSVLAAACVVLWLLGTHAVESELINRLGAPHPAPSEAAISEIDVIIVLSGGFVTPPVAGYEQPDAWTTARLIQGVRTFQRSGARLLVVSGAGPGEDATGLAHSMKELAVQLGVPAEQIVVEPNSRNTRQHPIELAKLNIVAADETVGVVTSSWHLPRAMGEFESTFPNTVAVPAFDTPIGQKRGLLRWMPRSLSLASSATALSEYIGMVWYTAF